MFEFIANKDVKDKRCVCRLAEGVCAAFKVKGNIVCGYLSQPSLCLVTWRKFQLHSVPLTTSSATTNTQFYRTNFFAFAWYNCCGMEKNPESPEWENIL